MFSRAAAFISRWKPLVATALALAVLHSPSTAEAQTKTCGVSGLPSCPSAPPLISKWRYSANSGFGVGASPWYETESEAADWQPSRMGVGAGPGRPCVWEKVNKVHDNGPHYTYGIETQDNWYFTYRVVTALPDCALNWDPVHAELIMQRTLGCPTRIDTDK